jgi:hypothetical protein
LEWNCPVEGAIQHACASVSSAPLLEECSEARDQNRELASTEGESPPKVNEGKYGKDSDDTEDALIQRDLLQKLPHMGTSFNDLSVHLFPYARLVSEQAQKLWANPPKEHMTPEGEMI